MAKRTDIKYIEIVIALHDFAAEDASCISLKKGDLIYVQEKDPSGWWDGTVGHTRGWFPSNYIGPVEVHEPTDQAIELPEYWSMKQNSSGEIYFYNSQTNSTASDIHEVLSAEHRRSLVKAKRISLLPAEPAASSWIPGPASLLSTTENATWELLINNILKAISNLNYSAKNNIKSRYIQESNHVARAIRDMLICSNTLSSDSPVIVQNPTLAPHHNNIMSSLSKLLLSAKVSFGLWPPANAVHKMRYQAGQVLLAVRHFVAISQECQIPLTPVASDALLNEFDLRGSRLSDNDLISQIDQNSDSIMNTIASLVTQITRDRMISPLLIEKVRKTIVEIGQFMSLVEDIKLAPSKTAERQAEEFVSKKNSLYGFCHQLLNAACTDAVLNNKSLSSMLEITTSVLESLEEVILASKILIDRKELLMIQSVEIEHTEDSDLGLLQRRTMALTILETEDETGRDSNSGREGKNAADGKIPVRTHSTYRRSSHASASGLSDGPYSAEESGSAKKLAKFFGEESATLTSPAPADNVPWFLRKEANQELSFNMEGAVNGGSFDALVERLTGHDSPADAGFVTSFLLTFHLFATTEQLFDALVKRFMLAPPEGLTNDEKVLWVDKKLSLIQIRVCNAFKSWIESYWNEELDDAFLDNIFSFVTGPVAKAQPALSTRLQDLLKKRIESDIYKSKSIKAKRLTRFDEMPNPILPKSLQKFTLYELDPLEVARQLTIMESNLFTKVKPFELMKQQWTKKDSKAVNVKAMTSNSTKITGWIKVRILGEVDVKKRAAVLKFFIKVAERCLSLHNYNTLFALQAAFDSSSIIRLSKTWELLSGRTMASLESMKHITDHARNYADYRAAIKNAPLPALPFLGLFLKDLVFTDDGNPDFRMGKLINFDKYVKTAKIIQDLTYFQVPYSLAEIDEVQQFLLQSFCEINVKDEQELYDISLILEPRDTEGNGSRLSQATPEEIQKELESKIGMLEKAGIL